MKTVTWKFIFLALSILAPTFSHGQNVDMSSKEELEIREKALKRLYPGGKDEEPLKVQSQLIPPSRKVLPNTGLEENSGGGAQDD